jgi:NADH:ubiquinone oxidoreductase subunit 4 (subunit M)
VAVALSKTGSAAVSDLRLRELAVLLPLLALIFYLGAQPAVLTTPLGPSVDSILRTQVAAPAGSATVPRMAPCAQVRSHGSARTAGPLVSVRT